MLLLKSFGIWLLILPCAIANGAFREAVLVPVFGNPAASIASGLLLSACILAIALLLVPRLGDLGRLRPAVLGLFWLGLTVAFEFGFGRLVMHRAWEELFEAYTFNNGDIWPLVLLTTFIAPVFAARLRQGSSQVSSKTAA
jgi:hypothetical protein